jgi:hypothetical protein
MMPGQKMSGNYPGYIDCGNGSFRKPFTWVDRSGRERSGNHYYVEVNCAHCNLPTLGERRNAKRARVFCDAQCRTAKRRSENLGRKVLRKREHGKGHHILVKAYDHPRAGRSNQVYEHILVAEQKIGRPISKEERVHHINCVKSDNRPENLFVCATDSEHFRIHGTLNQCVAQLIEVGVLRFDTDRKSYVVVKP